MAQDYNPAPNLAQTATVPSASIIDAAISKPLKEQQMHQANVQAGRDAIKSIFDAVEQGQRISANAVEAAQKRQAMAAQKALAQHAGDLFPDIIGSKTETSAYPMGIKDTGSLQTAAYDPETGAVTPNQSDAESIPSLNSPMTQYGAVRNQVETRTPDPRRELAITAANAYPKGVSDQIANMLFPTPTAASTGQTEMKPLKLSLNGSKGPRNVTVGIIGQQLVNPATRQPFNKDNPTEVDDLPGSGFVNRENIVGTTPNGEPVYNNGTDQATYRKDKTGNRIDYSGKVIYPKLSNPTDGEINSLQGIVETRSNLKEAMSNFKPEFVGPIAGRYATFAQYFQSLTDDKRESMRAMINEIDTIRRHDYFGSALTETEKSSYDQINLNSKLSPKAFMIRVESLERKLNNREKALRATAGATGRTFRDTPRYSVPDAQGSSDMDSFVEGD